MSDTTCAVDDCARAVQTRQNPYCRKHAERIRRNGSLQTQKPGPKIAAPRACVISGCDEPHKGYGYCRSHLRIERLAGRLDVDYADCAATGCARPVHANGLCEAHGLQQRTTGLLRPIGSYSRRGEECSFDGCEKKVSASDLCTGHYAQKRDGRTLAPLRVGAPKGMPCSANEQAGGSCDRLAQKAGMCETHRRRFLREDVEWYLPVAEKAPDGAGFTNKDGYRVISVNGKRRMEHCHNAELVLGRPLRPEENVHHVNGNRLDNATDGPFVMDERGRLRSGRLEVWSTFQPAGQEIGPKLEWAIEMLETYQHEMTDAMYAKLGFVASHQPAATT